MFKEDPGFYHAVRLKGFLDDVFPESAHSNYRDWSDIDLDGAIRFYEENFPGMSRSQLRELDHGFEGLLVKKGWIHIFFEKGSHSDWSSFDLEKTKEYYQKNLAGRTRTDVHKEDPRFYQFVHRMGWADEVFPPWKRTKKK